MADIKKEREREELHRGIWAIADELRGSADGSTKNIRLLDKKNVHNNSRQVINQYAVTQRQAALHDNRYDVTILVNGLPLVHIELKRRGSGYQHEHTCQNGKRRMRSNGEFSKNPCRH